MKLAALVLLAVFSLSPSLADEPSVAARLLGALPLVRDVHLSPDGNYLAFQSGGQGEEKFVVMDIAGKNPRQISDLGANSSMVQTVQANWIAWKGNKYLLAGTLACRENTDSDKVLATSGLILDRGGNDGEGTVRPMRLEKVLGRDIVIQFGDRVISFLPDDPDHVLVEARVEHELYPDVLRVDVATGLSETVTRPHSGFTDWMADGAGAVRLAVAFPHQDLRRIVYVRARDGNDWRALHEDVLGADPAFIPLAFARENPATLFVSVEESGHLAIRQFDTETLAAGAIVAADPQADVTPELRRGELIGYRVGDGEVTYLDEGWRHTADAIRKAVPGAGIELIDRSDDGRRALVRLTDGARPPVYFLLDKRADGTHLDPIGASRDERIAAHTAPVIAVSYPAQDGTLIPAYVTLPLGPRQGPAPFVVLLHDGPAARDRGGFDYVAQFLANEGYGVFQPQFRGSTAPTGALGAGLRVAGVDADAAATRPVVQAPPGFSTQPYAQAMPVKKNRLATFYGKTKQAKLDYGRAYGVDPNAAAQLARISGPDGVDMMVGPQLEAIVDSGYDGLSGGSGPAFTRAGLGAWGRSIQDDITDGTHWLITQGYADPNRLCIAGAGFGGYSALMGAAQDPMLYRCAAAYAPVTDLGRLDTDAKPYINGNYLRGYLRANGDSLSEISPVAQADRIDIPVLLVHGRQDCDVPVMQSEEMEAALLRQRDKVGSVQIANVPGKGAVGPQSHAAARPGRSVMALYLDQADHGLNRASDRIAYLSALEAFLAANLKPGS